MKTFLPSRAFVYVEINNSASGSMQAKPVYTIDYNKNNKNGCSKIQFRDETDIRAEIEAHRKKGVTLLSKLPPKVNRIDGDVKRIPYSLSWLK
jgi:hypothetical protein